MTNDQVSRTNARGCLVVWWLVVWWLVVWWSGGLVVWWSGGLVVWDVDR